MSTRQAGAPVYRLEKLVKEYGPRRVLQVDQLEVQPGEVIALVGPSGAGKSTLLRLLNFLEPPTAGRFFFQGQEWRYSLGRGQDLPVEQRRQVTTVFQQPMLLNASVWNNVSYGLRLRGNRNGHDTTQAALARVGLEHLAHHPARSLSGGEAQRVALARALVIRPSVLLLDEPTANLDPYNIAKIEEVVQQLNREEGVTVLLVTHNVFQARRLASKVALMLEGRLVEMAPAEDFFEAPRDPRTAAFVEGRMVY